MKPLPSQGSDKHHILSSSFHSLPRCSSFLALCVTTTGAHKAIYQKTEPTVMLFIYSLLSRKKIAKIEYLCLFSNISTLFIPKTMGKHLSSILATKRKHRLPPTTAWKNQPPSMKKSLQQSLLRRKICHPYFPSSRRRGQRCDSVQNGETH